MEQCIICGKQGREACKYILCPEHDHLTDEIKRKERISEEQKSFFEAHKNCYRKEAKAILEGKHWENKNKCVKLIDD